MALLMSVTWTFAQSSEDEGNETDNVACVSGIVKDQDGAPIPNAKVTLNDYKGNILEETTDETGRYKILVKEDEDYYPTVTAAHHAPFVSEFPITPNKITGDWNIVLYNAIDYQKNVCSTIILPVDPDPSVGIYYRLDHCTSTSIVFEREWAPKAGIPYVFTPNKDLRIDLREMNLPTDCFMVQECSGAFIWASYGEYYIMDSAMAMNIVCIFNDDARYHIMPMHALFGYRYNEFEPNQEPEIIFHEEPYRPFIEEDKVWKVGWLPSYSNEESLANIYFYFDGDTIIDGRTCKKMVYEYKEYKEEYKAVFEDIELQGKLYDGAFYEVDRCVLYAEKGRTKLSCLYDFSVEPGDSWPSSCDGYINYVTEKKMGNVDGFKGRNWTILTEGDEYEIYAYQNLWMEGVGSKFNPSQNLFYPFIKGGNIWLLMECRVGDEVIYHNPDIIDGVNPPDDTKKRIDFTHVVKPKPKAPQQEAEAEGNQLSGAYTVRLLDLDLGTMSDTYHVIITDDTGETVYDKTVRTADVLALNIDISEWTAPSYTITVENDYEQYVGTFSPTPTSISLPPTPTQIEKDGIIYDLQGRRVTTPTKSLYIKDGKKYLKL